jgi:hypothetical protein
MKLGKNEYACVFLQPGYWETGVLRNFFQAGASDDPKLPAYFWTDNCDFDSDANCYKFVLSPLHDNKIEETVYLPREYVVLVVVQKTAPPPGEIGKMGFKLPERSSR